MAALTRQVAQQKDLLTAQSECIAGLEGKLSLRDEECAGLSRRLEELTARERVLIRELRGAEEAIAALAKEERRRLASGRPKDDVARPRSVGTQHDACGARRVLNERGVGPGPLRMASVHAGTQASGVAAAQAHEREKERSRGQIAELEQQVAQLRSRLESQGVSLDAARAAATKDRAALTEAAAARAAAESRAARLQSRVGSLSRSLAAAEARTEEVEARSAEFERRALRAEDARDRVAAAARALEMAGEELRGRNRELRERLDSAMPRDAPQVPNRRRHDLGQDTAHGRATAGTPLFESAAEAVTVPRPPRRDNAALFVEIGAKTRAGRASRKKTASSASSAAPRSKRAIKKKGAVP